MIGTECARATYQRRSTVGSSVHGGGLTIYLRLNLHSLTLLHHILLYIYVHLPYTSTGRLNLRTCPPFEISRLHLQNKHARGLRFSPKVYTASNNSTNAPTLFYQFIDELEPFLVYRCLAASLPRCCLAASSLPRCLAASLSRCLALFSCNADTHA